MAIKGNASYEKAGQRTPKSIGDMQREITELKGTIAGMQQTISGIIGSVKTIDYVNDIKQSNVFKEYVSSNNQIAKICTFSNGVKICSLNLSIKVKKANNFNNFEILYLRRTSP